MWETIRFLSSARGLLPEPDKPYGRHSPLWRDGMLNAGALRESPAEVGLQPGLRSPSCWRLEDGHPLRWKPAALGRSTKLKDVRERMADLARMEAVLSRFGWCAAMRGRGNVSCR